MPRKKHLNPTHDPEAVIVGSKDAEPQSPAAPLPNMPVQSAAEDVADDGAANQKSWASPYKTIFISKAKGFEMGENRRFKQRLFIFNEKPEEQVLSALKENGFIYRPAEKAWTIPANPVTRVLSDELAQQFAGESPSQSR